MVKKNLKKKTFLVILCKVEAVEAKETLTEINELYSAYSGISEFIASLPVCGLDCPK